MTSEVFYLRADNEYLAELHGYYTFVHSKAARRKISYIRFKEGIIRRGNLGHCKPTLDVLAWLMDAVNAKHKLLVMAYGGLIHFHREHDFIDEKGAYFDDDIDMWASLETILLIANMERELFTIFGWTVRFFVHFDYVNGKRQENVLFLQVVPTCNHDPTDLHPKANTTEPVIDIYPFSLIHNGKNRLFKDLWHGTKFSESLIYPPRCIEFTSMATARSLHLQIPHDSFSVLECLYGTWQTPSKRHAKTNATCMENFNYVSQLRSSSK